MHTTSCNHITLPHHVTASHHRIIPLHYVTASDHCAITHEAPEAPPTPLGDVSSLYRSTTGPCDTLGRHYCPKTFPNSSARHPRATLCHFFVAGESALIPSRISSETHLQHPWATFQAYIVPQQFCATPLGNTLPLFRCQRVRIDPVSNKLEDSFSTLGRRFKPMSFPNRAARHSRATFQPLNVPHQFCAAPLGDITSPHRSPTEPRDTLGQHFATFSSPKRTH